MKSKVTRRGFMKQMGATTAAFASLNFLSSCSSSEIKEIPLISDPKGLLDLPEGFTYKVISETGEKMDDGFFVPERPDGMAAFDLPNGDIALIKNHEIMAEITPLSISAENLKKVPENLSYDGFKGTNLQLGGGTSTLILDGKTKERKKEFYSLVGTQWNCAGGATPWNTWISCEETDAKALQKISLERYVQWGLITEEEAKAFNYVVKKDHGFAFEVDPLDQELKPAKVLPALGRFKREAVAIDPRTNVIYQTEDDKKGLFYRFVPTSSRFEGNLQALKIKGRRSYNTRNFGGSLGPGAKLDVEWVDIADPEAKGYKLRDYGTQELGATTFSRGEGISVGSDGIYFICTDGGQKGYGQIWRYIPSYDEGQKNSNKGGVLELFYESVNKEEFFMGDNLAVAPWGDLIVCEDNYGMGFTNRLLGMRSNGEVYKIANNVGSSSEFAGACFSSDKTTMFVNLQENPGRTIAIQGDWSKLAKIN